MQLHFSIGKLQIRARRTLPGRQRIKTMRAGAKSFRLMCMAANDIIIARLKFFFYCRPGKLKTGRVLGQNNFFALLLKSRCKIIFDTARQQQVKRPEDRPHAAAVLEKLRIREAQRMPVGKKKLFSFQRDCRLFAKIVYAEALQHGPAQKKVPVADKQACPDAAAAELLQPLKYPAVSLIDSGIISPVIKQVAKYIQPVPRRQLPF